MPLIEEGTGQFRKEIFSNNLAISWDQITNGGFVSWQPQQFLYVNGVLETVKPVSGFPTPLEKLVMQTFTVDDPVLGIPVTISGAGVMAVFRQAFKREWDEREASIAATVPSGNAPAPNIPPEPAA